MLNFSKYKLFFFYFKANLESLFPFNEKVVSSNSVEESGLQSSKRKLVLLNNNNNSNTTNNNNTSSSLEDESDLNETNSSEFSETQLDTGINVSKKFKQAS